MPIPLDPALEQRLLRRLNFKQVETLAALISQLSAFYIQNPGAPTPWSKAYTPPAYLSYFLPLNFVRLKAAFRDVLRFLPASAIQEVWDFGSGLGTTHWVLESEVGLAPKPFFALEASSEAIALHKDLQAQGPTRWTPEFVKVAHPRPGALGVFSYSFLEMQNHLPKLESFAHLLIVEPSTREQGRSLMQWRAKLMERGFHPLAPCTHEQACPLLVHSPRDWCHQRVHFASPDWWQELEQHLPMKNRTLTFSYLLMSQTVRDEHWRGAARVIGDTLEENGKTRQMICRGEQREFLSWLHKKGEPPHIPHGALVRGVDGAEVRGSELRPLPGSLTWEE